MTTLKSSPRFGAHMSVAGGLENAFEAGVDVGCDCLQLFVKNPRQLRAKPLADDAVARFKSAASATTLAPVVAHANYLLNLGSPKQPTREASITGLIDELGRSEALGIPFVVLHPGAHLDASLEEGIAHVAASLNDVHARCAGYHAMILLETTAGQGTSIGHEFEHLRDIFARVREQHRLGVCLDTCHLFAAGHDFRTAEGYAAMMDRLDSAIGVALVKCIHMNDSKKDLGSRVDRHEHIGKGKIGLAGFRHFVNDPRFAAVPMILETPKGKDGRGADLDKVNLKRLRALVDR
jgi:deoxyribonuclease-4